MRIFLDANILFSASKQNGAVAKLLDECLKRKHILVLDGYVWAEAEKNLSATFPEGLAKLTKLKGKCAMAVFPRNPDAFPDISPILPEKDLPVLVSSIEAACDVLVTGDKKHFGALYGRVIHSVRILSPSMLFGML